MSIEGVVSVVMMSGFSPISFSALQTIPLAFNVAALPLRFLSLR